jgi:hypothetical protein
MRRALLKDVLFLPVRRSFFSCSSLSLTETLIKMTQPSTPMELLSILSSLRPLGHPFLLSR